MSQDTVCYNLAPLLQLVGYVVTIFKIVIPLLLIVFGMLDVGKSVVAGKPDEVTKNLKSFAMRCVAAVLVFFIPSIVGVVLDAVAATSDNIGADTTTGTTTGTVDDNNSNKNTAKGWRCCWDYALGGNGSSPYCSKQQ